MDPQCSADPCVWMFIWKWQVLITYVIFLNLIWCAHLSKVHAKRTFGPYPHHDHDQTVLHLQIWRPLIRWLQSSTQCDHWAIINLCDWCLSYPSIHVAIFISQNQLGKFSGHTTANFGKIMNPESLLYKGCKLGGSGSPAWIVCRQGWTRIYFLGPLWKK